MNQFDQNLHIRDEAFAPMIDEADRVLQRLLKNMVERSSLEGSVTIKIDISMDNRTVENFDPNISGDTRQILVPSFQHKVSSIMQIKDESKGSKNYDGYEMVMDEETGEYILRPVTNTAQQTIFDVEYADVGDDSPNEANVDDPPALVGRKTAALPSPDDEVGSEEDLSEEFDGLDYQPPVFSLDE